MSKLGLTDEQPATPLTKHILTKAHLEAFRTSQTHKEIVDTVEEFNASIVGIKLGQAGETSAVSQSIYENHAHLTELAPRGPQPVKSILAMLDEVEEIAKSIPPVDNSASRFGNPAFKTFYDKVQEVRCED